MYLKIMSGEELPDDHSDKAYRVIECQNIQFYRHGFNYPTQPSALITGGLNDGEYPLTGNAYVLNNAGKTIDSFACARAVKTDAMAAADLAGVPYDK